MAADWPVTTLIATGLMSSLPQGRNRDLRYSQFVLFLRASIRPTEYPEDDVGAEQKYDRVRVLATTVRKRFVLCGSEKARNTLVRLSNSCRDCRLHTQAAQHCLAA